MENRLSVAGSDPTPCWPHPQLVTPGTCSNYLKITTYYLILEWRLVGPLSQACPPGSNL